MPPYTCRLRAASPPGDGGGYRVRLPPSALEALARESAVGSSPLTFELRSGGCKTFCGVEQFTAAEGSVELPRLVAEALGLSVASTPAADASPAAGAPPPPPELLAVTHVQLPLATSVTLASLAPGFAAAARDHRAALEAALRAGGYVALHAGLVIPVSVEGRTYPLAVTATSPAGAAAVVVIDTDCDVVLEGAEADAAGVAAAAAAAERAAPLQLGVAAHGRVAAAPGRYAYFSVALGAQAQQQRRLLRVTVTRDDAPRGGGEESEGAGGGGSAAARGSGGGREDDQDESELDVYAGWPPHVVKPTLVLHDGASDQRLASRAAPRTLELALGGDGHAPPGDVVYVGVTRTAVAAAPPPSAPPSAAAAVSMMMDVDSGSPPPPPPSPGGGVRADVGSGRADGGAATERFVITATLVDAPPQPPSPPLQLLPPPPPPPGSAVCDNCRAVVPAASLPLHAAVCGRNHVRCAHPDCGALLRRGPAAAAEHAHCADCGALMPARALRKHAALYHTPMPCPAGCGAGPMRQAQLAAHVRSQQCPRAYVLCRFCGVHALAGPPPRDFNDRLRGLSGHESDCGARTAPCGGCRRPVPLKQHAAHWAAVHPADAPLPPALDLPPPPAAAGAAGVAAAAPGGGGGSLSASSWACAACSFLNDAPRAVSAGRVVCAMCGNEAASPAPPAGGGAAGPRSATPTNGSGGGGGGGGGTLPPPALLPQPCRNQPCAGGASRVGDAARLQLCSRCYSSWGRVLPHEDDSDDAEELAGEGDEGRGGGDGGGAPARASHRRRLSSAVGRDGEPLEPLCALYRQQLGVAGCSSSGGGGGGGARCVHGATPGASAGLWPPSAAPGDDSSIDARLAWLLSEAQATPPRYYVCVGGGAPQPGGAAASSRPPTPTAGSPALAAALPPPAPSGGGGFMLGAAALRGGAAPPRAAAAGGSKKAAARVAGAFF